MEVIEYFIIAAIVLILGAVGYGGWKEYKSEKLTLIKSEFVCSEYKTERKYRPQLIGKVTVQMPYDDEVCTNYKGVAP